MLIGKSQSKIHDNKNYFFYEWWEIILPTSRPLMAAIYRPRGKVESPVFMRVHGFWPLTPTQS
jgi:hypothetical protein